MHKIVAAQLHRRLGRALALLLGILVATVGLTVMTASARTTQLREVGAIRANSRASYDILVRPRGVRTSLEKSEGLVRGDFLSGIYGGITLAEWHEILRMPGVSVAAPVEILAYALPTIRVPIYLTRYVPDHGQAVFRIQSTWVSDDGLSKVINEDYLYTTPYRLTYGQADTEPLLRLPSGRQVSVCPQQGDLRFDAYVDFSCVNSGSAAAAGTQYGWPETWAFPFLIAAIDPVQEAKLDGLDRAVTSGRYLEESDTSGSSGMPVLVSNAPDFQLNEQVTVERLSSAAIDAVMHGAGSNGLARYPGTELYRRTVTSADAYIDLLQQLLHPAPNLVSGLGAYWTGSPVSFSQSGPRSLTPLVVHNPLTTWTSNVYTNDGYTALPADGLDTSFERLHEHVATSSPTDVNGVLPLRAVGTFNPAKVEAESNLARLPLGLFQNPAVTGADTRSRQLLGHQALIPDGDIAGYLQQAPLMLTTMSGAQAMFGGIWTSSGDAAAPISSIRVRVAGVTGVDSLSQARVRLVAEEIAQRTGLQVDITVGASETPVTIHLPAGTFGRPALNLAQIWVKLGVALSLIRALDTKTVTLSALSLVVCAIFVLNASAAAVRARTVQLGVLATLGWQRRQLFGIVLGELAVIGFLAGAAGVVIAIAIGRMLGLTLPAWHAALVLPGAVLLALLAGVVPAWQAGRVSPVQATRPAVSHSAIARKPRSVSGLAIVNLVRIPGRTALAVVSLAIGVAVLALLLSVELAFHGTAIGTLLGNVVALQVHGQDVAAVVMVLVLSALGVGDVLFLSVQERSGELATLSATGWRSRSLTRLVLTEAAGVGLAGSVVGGGAGLVITGLISGGVPAATILGALAAAGVGLLVAAGACALPVRVLHHLPVATLLSEE